MRDYTNFGTWTERGAEDASTRATAIWKEIVGRGPGIKPDADRVAGMEDYIRRRTVEAEAPPES